MEVRKIMTKNPACATPDSTLQEVAHMMDMYDCGCIPIVEDHKTNRPIGTITDRDIAIRALAAGSGGGGNPADMKASDIMTTEIATVTPDTSIEQCRDQMEERQIRRILVVDKNGRCVGIVAQADVVQNETNPRQTAEFIRDVSKPTDSQYDRFSFGQNQSDSRESNEHVSQYVDMASERDSYRNFSNQNRSSEREFSYGRDRDNQSSLRGGKKFKKSRKKEKSFFGFGTLMPLLVAVGAGAALKYYMGVDQKSQTTFVPRAQVTSSVHQAEETTPKVSIELPTTETARTEIDASRDISIGNRTDSTFDTTLDNDLDTTPGIGKTARL